MQAPRCMFQEEGWCQARSSYEGKVTGVDSTTEFRLISEMLSLTHAIELGVNL